MIKIDEKYYIDADAHNYVLKEFRINKDKNSPKFGEETYEILGYYPCLELLFKGIIKNELREYISTSTQKDIKDLCEKIKELNEHIEKLNISI